MLITYYCHLYVVVVVVYFVTLTVVVVANNTESNKRVCTVLPAAQQGVDVQQSYQQVS